MHAADKIVPQLLAWVLLGIVYFIGAYDVWALFNRPREATVSYAIMQWAYDYPIITLLLGVVIGHLFFPQSPVRDVLSVPPPANTAEVSGQRRPLSASVLPPEADKGRL